MAGVPEKVLNWLYSVLPSVSISAHISSCRANALGLGICRCEPDIPRRRRDALRIPKLATEDRGLQYARPVSHRHICFKRLVWSMRLAVRLNPSLSPPQASRLDALDLGVVYPQSQESILTVVRSLRERRFRTSPPNQWYHTRGV